MPTITVDVRAKELENNLVELYITRNNQFIRSTLFLSEVDTPLKLASWILTQKGKQETISASIQKRLSITFHNDVDGNSIIDNLDVAPLPQDDVLSILPSASSVLTMTATEVRQVVSELVRYIQG